MPGIIGYNAYAIQVNIRRRSNLNTTHEDIPGQGRGKDTGHKHTPTSEQPVPPSPLRTTEVA